MNNAGAQFNSSTPKGDRDDFRNHLATAEQDGRRRWLYPKKPAGRFYRWRTYLSWLLLAIMFVGPFVRINGNPLLMINIVERRFSILGQIFWPQDTVVFAVAMLVFLTGIVIFTTAFGRLWCGWTCPHVLLQEMVFRKIEYFIEGDSHEQRALNKARWNISKATKKILKHGAFFGLSFVISNTLLSYIIGSQELLRIVTDPPSEHITGLAFLLAFTLLFYGIFARFREQACTFICPYGRFQSAMLDENSLIVAYDYQRGEKREPLHRGQTSEERTKGGFGDCVNCRQCVAVCPTGIDIRNGLQMECVNCTACIDACDTVMDKIGRPRGLIRFASVNGIAQGEKLRFTPRMLLNSVVLIALVALFLFLLFTRSAVETSFLRAPGSLFQQAQDGKISNLYTVKVVNKTSRDMPIEMKLENVAGALKIMGTGEFVVPKEKLAQGSVLVELAPSEISGSSIPLKIGIYSEGKLIETVKTTFIGPRNQHRQ